MNEGLRTCRGIMNGCLLAAIIWLGCGGLALLIYLLEKTP